MHNKDQIKLLLQFLAFQIQYTTEETNKKKFLPPREATWRRSKQTEVKLEEDETIDPEVGGESN